MGIQITWALENRVLRVDFERNWTTEEYFAGVKQANDLVVQADPRPIGVILNAQPDGTIPRLNLFDIGRQTPAIPRHDHDLRPRFSRVRSQPQH